MGRGGAPREEKETEKRSKEKEEEEETDGRGRGGEIEALDKRVVGWSRRGWQGETESVESSSSHSREPAGLLS